ncbi:MAG: hypothetical protein U9R51_05520 [Actinomycetota bacterium]|nr:hypothetical protein [Actinomycetota bacterium]
MSTTAVIGGERFDVLVCLLDFLRVRRKPSGWYDVTATIPADLGEVTTRALEAIESEIRTRRETRSAEALRADAFVELVQRISEESHRARDS